LRLKNKQEEERVNLRINHNKETKLINNLPVELLSKDKLLKNVHYNGLNKAFNKLDDYNKISLQEIV
jgi:hypothetical protein